MPKIFYLAVKFKGKAMALSREKKKQLIDEVATLLADSKLIVAAQYEGTSVKALQQLRQQAKSSNTTIKVVKNRLFKKALGEQTRFKEVDSSSFKGQLLYAFNSDDEVAPAQSLANFAKTEPQVEFVTALTADGQILGVDELKTLASLPTKEQLRAQLVGTISAPVSGFVNVLSGNVRGILNVLSARVKSLES